MNKGIRFSFMGESQQLIGGGSGGAGGASAPPTFEKFS